MFPGRLSFPGRASRTASSPAPSPESARRPSTRARRNLAALGIASVVFLALVLYGLGTFNSPPSSSTAETTSYDTLASSVISSAANHLPSGYSQGSSRLLSANEPGLVSSVSALYSNQGGTLANMTILVFSSPASAETYIASVISNAKGLSGYSDATSTLTGYEHFGVCYGYAESDPEGGQYVANGVCTKGNVYIQVHLAATSSLPSAEGDMAGFVGAAYAGLN